MSARGYEERQDMKCPKTFRRTPPSYNGKFPHYTAYAKVDTIGYPHAVDMAKKLAIWTQNVAAWGPSEEETVEHNVLPDTR